MKSKTIVVLFYLCMYCFNAAPLFSWDFPLSMDVIAIKFDHRILGSTSALDICKNTSTNIYVPEYDTSAQRNEEFAYVSGDDPDVFVKFFTVDFDPFTALTIDAINDGGDTNWNLADKEFYFNGSGFSIGDSNYVAFDTESGFPTSVQSTDVSWSWRIVKVGGVPRSPYEFDDTDHNFYVLIDEPENPWETEELRTEVLEKACYWADDETTKSGAAIKIARNLYSNFGDRDGDLDYTPYDAIYSCGTYTRSFYLTSFLEALSSSSNVNVNCSDMANLFAIFSTAIGCESESCKHTRNGSDETNNIDPIGDIYGLDTYSFTYHQHGLYNSNVFDAVLKFEGETYPPTNMTQNDFDSDLGFIYYNTYTGYVDLQD